MSPLRKLAGQTAIYGVSSILGRVMTFLLTPLYTRVFLREEYGIVTELYAYVAFALVILTYGMETSFFRFGSRAETNTERSQIFSTAFLSIIFTTAVFVGLVSMNLDGVAGALNYSDFPNYILYFTFIIAFDVLCTIPLARLRLLNKPIVFAAVNLSSVGLNIALNLFFILYCPYALKEGAFGSDFIRTFYNPNFGIGYIFVSNVASSALKLLMLSPWMLDIRSGFHIAQIKKLLPYSLPLLFLGIGGIINETFDRAFFTELSGLPESVARMELAVYGACYKVAMLLSIGIQAYRFAAEPFIFSLFKDENQDKTQADIMKYYVISACFIALTLLCFLDVAMLLVGEDFREGAGVIPILLAAYICFGAVFNLSFWYKMKDKTIFGAIIAAAGALVTIVLNIILVPKMSYYGSAWATLAAFMTMLLLSYFIGKKHQPVPYDLRTMGKYVGLSLLLFAIFNSLDLTGFLKYAAGTIAVAIFVGFTLMSERKLKKLDV